MLRTTTPFRIFLGIQIYQRWKFNDVIKDFPCVHTRPFVYHKFEAFVWAVELIQQVVAYLNFKGSPLTDISVIADIFNDSNSRNKIMLTNISSTI